MQTYFIAEGYIDYFRIVEDIIINNDYDYEIPLTQLEKDLFTKIKEDSLNIKKDLYREAGIVQDIGDSRVERVPWLYDITKFPFHLANLKDEEIWSSYKLLSKRELDSDSINTEDPYLIRILITIKALLRDTYQLYSNTSLDRKMTQ